MHFPPRAAAAAPQRRSPDTELPPPGPPYRKYPSASPPRRAGRRRGKGGGTPPAPPHRRTHVRSNTPRHRAPRLSRLPHPSAGSAVPARHPARRPPARAEGTRVSWVPALRTGWQTLAPRCPHRPPARPVSPSLEGPPGRPCEPRVLHARPPRWLPPEGRPGPGQPRPASAGRSRGRGLSQERDPRGDTAPGGGRGGPRHPAILAATTRLSAPVHTSGFSPTR